MWRPSILPILLLLLIPNFHLQAHGANGMDMSMDGAMQLSTGEMTSYLHFPSASSSGDTLWFAGWVTTSAGAVVGACVCLFLLGVAERCVAGVEGVVERAWATRAQLLHSKSTSTSAPVPTRFPRLSRIARTCLGFASTDGTPPLILAHDIPRGLLFVVRALIGVLFMWTVMTFQVAFILSIVVGLGVGEMLFGRYANRGAHLC